MKNYRALLGPVLGASCLLLLSGSRFQVVEAAAVGSADDCCCGERQAVGICCEWTSSTSCDTSAWYNGPGADCNYGGSFSTNQTGTCPDTAFDCSDTAIACSTSAPTTPAPTLTLSPVQAPTASPVPTAPAPPTSPPDPPPSNSSCTDVPGFGAVDSDGTCTKACETFGVHCVVVSGSSSSTSCGSAFSLSSSTTTGIYTWSCACGPAGSVTQICADAAPSGAPRSIYYRAPLVTVLSLGMLAAFALVL